MNTTSERDDHQRAGPANVWQRRAPTAILLTVGLVSGLLAGRVPLAAAADGPPPIRTTATNRVPACVTPQRMMAFITAANPALEPKFARIADDYRRHGEHWQVRWDYAVFQMILETNYLKYRRGDGKRGDVHPRQNNFAGLGATGGGVPGDSYPDVTTGVRAQIEHLVAYSGERVPDPVGARTRLKQDDIISLSRKLRRPVTFADLRNRWAADRNYARSIETLAQRFRAQHCTGREPAPAETAALPERPRMEARAAATPPAPSGPPSGVCSILAASYGGERTVLIRATAGAETQYTLLTVLDGFEGSLTRSYVDQHAPGGTAIGSFPSRAAALAKAKTLCP